MRGRRGFQKDTFKTTRIRTLEISSGGGGDFLTGPAGILQGTLKKSSRSPYAPSRFTGSFFPYKSTEGTQVGHPKGDSSANGGFGIPCLGSNPGPSETCGSQKKQQRRPVSYSPPWVSSLLPVVSGESPVFPIEAFREETNADRSAAGLFLETCFLLGRTARLRGSCPLWDPLRPRCRAPSPGPIRRFTV